MEPWVPKLTQGPVSQFCISFRLLWLGLQLLWNSGTDLSPALPVSVNSPRPLSKLRDPEQLPTSFDGEDDQMQLVLLRSRESWSQSWGPYQESIAPLLSVHPPRLLKALTQQLVVSSDTQILSARLVPSWWPLIRCS